jgi:hypothetical protein
MLPSASESASPDRGRVVDWAELSGLDRIAAAYQVSESSIVLELTDGREVRITAWRNLGTDRYVAHYERRSTVRSGSHEFRVWAHAPHYRRCEADDAAGCLEAAAIEVDRKHVY